MNQVQNQQTVSTRRNNSLGPNGRTTVSSVSSSTAPPSMLNSWLTIGILIVLVAIAVILLYSPSAAADTNAATAATTAATAATNAAAAATSAAASATAAVTALKNPVATVPKALNINIINSTNSFDMYVSGNAAATVNSNFSQDSTAHLYTRGLNQVAVFDYNINGMSVCVVSAGFDLSPCVVNVPVTITGTTPYYLTIINLANGVPSTTAQIFTYVLTLTYTNSTGQTSLTTYDGVMDNSHPPISTNTMTLVTS